MHTDPKVTDKLLKDIKSGVSDAMYFRDQQIKGEVKAARNSNSK